MTAIQGLSLDMQFQLNIGSPTGVYSYVQQPPFQDSFLFYQSDRLAGCIYNNTEVDPVTGNLQLKRIPLVADTLLSGATTVCTDNYNNPVSNAFIQGVDGKTNKKTIDYIRADNNYTWQIQGNTPIIGNTPMYINISRNFPAVATSADTISYNTFLSLAAESTPVKNPDGSYAAYPIQLYLPYNKPPYLQQALPYGGGIEWTWPAYGQNGTSGKTEKSQDLFCNGPNKNTCNIIIRCFPHYNILYVNINDGDEILILHNNITSTVSDGVGGLMNQTFTDANISIPNGKLLVKGTGGGTASLQFFNETNASTIGSFTIPTIQLETAYNGRQQYDFGDFYFDDLSCGANVTYTPLQYNTQLQAVISLTGSTSGSPRIPMLSTIIPAVYATGTKRQYKSYNEQGANGILSVQEHSWEDKYNMNDSDAGKIGWGIRNTADVTLGNYDGSLANVGGSHFSAEYSRRLVHIDSGGNIQPLTDYFTFITGFGGENVEIERNIYNRTWKTTLVSKDWQLDRVKSLVQKYGDGMCALAAMRLMLISGGIHPNFISSDPLFGFGTCDYSFNPKGCKHFKLPIGTAQNPGISFNPDQSYWQNLMQIAGYLQDVIMFNSSGVCCRYNYKFYIQNIAPKKGTFINNQNNDLMSWNDINMQISTINQRTGVMTITIDPNTSFRRITAAYAANQPGQADWNDRHGFRDMMLVVDKTIADPNAQNQVTQNLLDRITYPNIFCTTKHPTFLVNANVYDNYNIQEGGVVMSDNENNPTILSLTAIDIQNYFVAGETKQMGCQLTGRNFLSN